MSEDFTFGCDKEEPDSELQLETLKKFLPAQKGCWEGISDEEWNDWQWQLRNRITTLEQLKGLLPLTYEEEKGVKYAGKRLALAITPYFFNLIDKSSSDCPIRRQVVPRVEEVNVAPWEYADPCGEESFTPVDGIVHRYPDRVLFLVTDRCAAYCRYCTRSRLVSNATGYDFHPNFEKQIDYIRRHREVRDVLLSGGDPLLLTDAKIGDLLEKLRSIPHVELLRIGTRIPIFLPQRITVELCQTLKRFHPLFISIHTNHPKELTVEARIALERLADAGIPLGNQSVLLRGVNDNLVVMKALVQKLIMCRVKPYYLYQCDLVSGTNHLRTGVHEGIEIIKGLRGYTSGYAVPQYVIDAPGGGGKIPIGADYTVSHTDSKISMRNYEGKMFEYPEGADSTIFGESRTNRES
ncbi:MAG: KamA family radical SAM protein [Verrucomicrobiae bacterium]|nr:KamA family radical SAM protein [Verrucomicrobiae bacterium]